MSERAQALEAAIRQSIAELEVAEGLIYEPATDPAAWIDGVIRRLREVVQAPAEGVSPQPDQWATLRNDVKVLHKAAAGVEDNTPADDILRWLWRGKAIAYETVIAMMKRLDAAPVSPVEPTPEPPQDGGNPK